MHSFGAVSHMCRLQITVSLTVSWKIQVHIALKKSITLVLSASTSWLWQQGPSAIPGSACWQALSTIQTLQQIQVTRRQNVTIKVYESQKQQ